MKNKFEKCITVIPQKTKWWIYTENVKNFGALNVRLQLKSHETEGYSKKLCLHQTWDGKDVASHSRAATNAILETHVVCHLPKT